MKITQNATEPVCSIRLVQEGDGAEWLRLRLALWPDHTLQELEAERQAILARLESEPVFGAKARDEAGLETLASSLLHTVEETVQRAHVSLWLVTGASEAGSQRTHRKNQDI